MPLNRVRKAKAGRSGGRQPSLAKLKKKAWKLLSETIRREAAGHHTAFTARCFTCGSPHDWTDLQAGHAIGGRNGAVLFDEEIIRPQCVRCNIMLRGNYGEFIHRLIKEKARTTFARDHEPEGCAIYWWGEKLLSAKQIKKWSRSDLQAKIESYKERLKAIDPS